MEITTSGIIVGLGEPAEVVTRTWCLVWLRLSFLWLPTDGWSPSFGFPFFKSSVLLLSISLFLVLRIVVALSVVIFRVSYCSCATFI